MKKNLIKFLLRLLLVVVAIAVPLGMVKVARVAAQRQRLAILEQQLAVQTQEAKKLHLRLPRMRAEAARVERLRQESKKPANDWLSHECDRFCDSSPNPHEGA